jgi:hypothetical protein
VGQGVQGEDGRGNERLTRNCRQSQPSSGESPSCSHRPSGEDWTADKGNTTTTQTAPAFPPKTGQIVGNKANGTECSVFPAAR